jgi:hypothetical protein
MTLRGRVLAAVTVAAVISIAGCGQGGATPSATAVAGAAASQAGSSPGAARLTAVGLVMSIDSAGVTDVKSFQLRTVNGTVLEFDIVKGVDIGFPAGHLQEHRAAGEQVQVTYHVDGGRNLVDHLDDAPVPSGPASASPAT